MDLRWNLIDYSYFSDKSEDEILQDFKRQTKILYGLGHAEHNPIDKSMMEAIMQYSINLCENGKEKISDFYKSSKQCRKLINTGIKNCIEKISKIERDSEER